jgi:hypothetical protein
MGVYKPPMISLEEGGALAIAGLVEAVESAGEKNLPGW